jgi:transposase InsO family protein
MMKISTSTYYADSKISREEQEEKDADIRGKIEQLRVTYKRAGYRPLLRHLKRNGVEIGETKLRRIIHKFELQIRPYKKFVRTTNSNHDCLTHPNLIKDMTIDDVNQVWAADITYIRINNGFVFLAVILDLYSRKAIGWAISKRIDGNLAVDALKMAIARRKPPKGVIHHSDRGVQYLCESYVTLLNENGFHLSCSARGNPYDNAWLESFMKTLKYDEIYMGHYETYLDVIEKLPHFIEEVYNKKRLHSSIGYLPPEEFEEKIKLGYKNGNEKEGDRLRFTL